MKAVYPSVPPHSHFLARILVFQSLFFGNQAEGTQDELTFLQSSLHVGQSGGGDSNPVSLSGVVDQELANEVEDEDHDTGDPLLAEAISLQAKVKGLEGLMKLRIEDGGVEEYVKSNPDVIKLTKDLEKKLKTLHTKSKEDTMKSWKAVEKCKSKPNVSSADNAFQKEVAGYKKCRTEEQNLEIDVVKNKAEMTSIELERSAKKKMQKVQSKLMVDKKVCKTGFGEDYEMKLERLAKTWDDAYKALAASQIGSKKNDPELAEAKALYKKSIKLHKDKIKACKTTASNMDKAKCALFEIVSKHCATYTKCFHEHKTKFDLLVTTVKQTLALIKAQLNALSKISCYIDSGDNRLKLKECSDNNDEEFEDMNIDFPNPGDGYCEQDSWKPCTTGYLTVYYGGVHKAHLCTPCLGIKGKKSKS